ncbi:5-hydroxytryptamine receptor [Halyomorpha halys]|uniref:5-hydroxytryptamine receptor n=1 Tax=Halyomorpha halys TaxID=286706 RepID=UPI0006D52379
MRDLSRLLDLAGAACAEPVPSTGRQFCDQLASIISSHLDLTNLTGYQLANETDSSQGIATAALSVVLGIVILITVLGNVFVIAAILLERSLQSVANYLIVSLAVADLMVACLVMPLGAVYEISNGWILSPELCDMWTSSDVLCCTASILHLVAIAVDRYWAVTNVDYIHTRNATRIIWMIVVVWTVALVVSLAPQFGWKDPDYLDRITLQQRCLVSQDIGYQVFATCSTFYVPLLVILVLYWKIFQTARKRIRRRRGQRSSAPEPIGEKSSSTSIKFFSRKKKEKRREWETSRGESALVEGSTGEHDSEAATTAFTITNHASVAVGRRKRDTKRETIEAKRERKAAKTLAIITGAFVVCWLPFFIMALLMPLCPSCEISDSLASLFLWLGYFNSTLNPIIYTVFSPEFRLAFKKMLCGVSRSSQAQLR